MARLALTATTTFEVEIGLSGTFYPGSPETGPSYACGGTPAEPDSVDDVEVTSLDGVRRTAGGWTQVDLLAGLPPEAKRILLANIADFIAEEAQSVLLAEVPEAGE